MTRVVTLGYLTLDSTPLETLDAAAVAGFRSVGIGITARRYGDPYVAEVLGNRRAIAAIRRRIADTGLRLSNISAYHLYPDVPADTLQQILDTTAELGSRIVVVNNYIEDAGALAAALSRFCEHAATLDIRVALEFMRYSRLKTLGAACDLMATVGMPNLGLLVDSLHLARSGGTPDEVKALRPGSIVFAQLCDAKAAPADTDDATLRQEARTGRLYPGDGVLPLRAFVAALPADCEIEYEVPRQDLGDLTMTERARIAMSVCRHFLGRENVGAA